jgi:hypothetical protein
MGSTFGVDLGVEEIRPYFFNPLPQTHVCMHMYAYIYICMYIYAYICMHSYVYGQGLKKYGHISSTPAPGQSCNPWGLKNNGYISSTPWDGVWVYTCTYTYI